jgi:iron complex transport system ATP-binding protein
MSVSIAVEGLRVRLGGAEVLRGVDAAFREGELTAIVGPNGAGKSTLMSVLSGFRTEYEGRCTLDGREVARWNKRELARRMTFIPQFVRVEFPFTAEQVVYMGRTPYCHGLFEGAGDREEVDRAMRLTDTLQFAARDFRQLSGGERQRVVLAGALAQQPSVLLLDEPTTFLDLKHQIETYRLLAGLAAKGLTVVAVTHDLNLAAAYAGRMVVLHNGQVFAEGAPAGVLTAALLRDVFGVAAEVRGGTDERPWIYFGGAAQGTPEKGTEA